MPKETHMNRRELSVLIAALPVAMTVAGAARAEEPMREEAAEHPRIARAIRELEDAIHYMEAAPHDFGGHKAAAIEASRHAVMELRRALAFRARHD
jgi:hypothetical protein